jgi:hypothetical protein
MFKKAIVFTIILVPLLTVSAHTSQARYDIPISKSPSWGPENAPVTIIEFIDYQ